MLVTLDEFSAAVTQDIDRNSGAFYRGQRDANWKLIPSLFRTPLVGGAADSVKGYFEVVLPFMLQKITNWANRSWDLSNSFQLAEFVAFLQHNGFPTPLLDWTLSPYVAAYFAFESVSPFNPPDARLSIFRFDAQAWANAYANHYDYTLAVPNVAVLTPRGTGNQKMVLQQGCFTWSNVADIEDHIRTNEVDGRAFLTRYELLCSERSRAMRHLKMMGISAVQLMPSIESVCKSALEDIVALAPLNQPVDLPAAKDDLLGGADA